MYDEFVKRLREYAKEHCPLDRGSGICGCIDAREAADAIEALSKRVEELEAAHWIPVKEVLPEEEVLAVNALKGTYGYHEYLIGYIYENCESDSGFICENESEALMNVTHWMPLPEPPKEEKK
jgi:hypothetical protein